MKAKCGRTILGLLLLLVLSGCGNALPVPSSSDGAGAPDAEKQTVLAPMDAPPILNDRPPLPGQSGRERTADGLPVLQPPRGVNTKMLFADRISDTDDRFDRLENAVQELRQDFDSMLPSLVRLVAIEKDIDALVGQLENLVDEGPQDLPPPQGIPPPAVSSEVIGTLPPADLAAAPIPLAPEQAPPEIPSSETPAPETPAPLAVVPQTPPAAGDLQQGAEDETAPAPDAPQASSGKHLIGIRTGTNGRQDRLVFDLSAAMSYKHELDEAEGLLLITFPEASWNAAFESTALKSNSVASWHVEKTTDGKGAMVIIVLAPGTKIAKTFTLPADGPQAYRVVFDLEKP